MSHFSLQEKRALFKTRQVREAGVIETDWFCRLGIGVGCAMKPGVGDEKD